MPKKRTAPVLYYGNVPEAQLNALQLVGLALNNLAYFAECFEADLSLFDSCAKQIKTEPKRKEQLRNWQFVAARDGVVSIYNFSEALSSVAQSLHECPHIKSRLKYSMIEAAKARFKSHFPNAKRLRHSVGHAGEKASNSHEHAKHGYTGKFKISTGRPVRVRNFIAIDVLNGRKYSNTWDHRVESYRIGPTTLARLKAVRDGIWDAFDEMNSRLRDV
jgi:hypothetical protein